MCVQFEAVCEATAKAVARRLRVGTRRAAVDGDAIAGGDSGFGAESASGLELEGVRVYPRRVAPVVDSAFSVTQPTWGFAVPGHTDLVFNARLESTRAGMGLWRAALENGRCVVPACAFFETHKTQTCVDAKTGRTKHVLYRFAPVGTTVADEAVADTAAGKLAGGAADGLDRAADGLGQMLLMAGLVQDERFSIITTTAADPVRRVHPRMPLLLGEKAARAWLTEGLAAAEDALRAGAAVRLVAVPDAQAPISEQLSMF